MSQMIRTRADNKKWEELFEEYGIDLKFTVALRFIDAAIALAEKEVREGQGADPPPGP